jgi:hypothetical protein
MRHFVSLLLIAYPLAAQSWAPTDPTPRPFAAIDVYRPASKPPHQALYGASVAALVGANAADLSSSWGRPELNPILTPSGSGARFGWQSATIKLGFTATTLLIQRYILRRRPDLRRSLAISNFIAAGALGGVAARNQLAGAPRTP